MANKSTKPVHHAKVFTPEQIQEQKKNQALAMIVQKREQFAINILANIVKGNAFAYPKEQDKDSFLGVVDLSVEMADRLVQKLYPVTREDKK